MRDLAFWIFILGCLGVFLAYRYPFRYVLHPLQRRRAELFGHPSTVAAKG